MGIDFLDLMFRLEKQERIVLLKKAAEESLRQRFEEGEPGWFGIRGSDIRVGAFYEGIASNCAGLCELCAVEPRKRLRVFLFRERAEEMGRCSKCGSALPRKQLTWETFRRALAGVLNMDEEAIRPEMWLFGDLKFG